MRRLWWLAIALSACGDVNRAPDAAVADAYQPDSPTELTCAAGEMACGGACADVMTSEQYCGSCNTHCAPNHGCVGGTCVPANTSCARVREVDPASPNDLYVNPNNGTFFYCDFDTNTQYSALTLTKYNAVPAGNTLVRATDLQGPGAAAFIKLFNKQGGTVAPAPLAMIGNCCYQVASTVGLQLAGKLVTPAQAGTAQCIDTMPAGVWQFTINFVVQPNPLPDDYFTTNPATEVASGCSDSGGNPGISWKKATF